MIKDFNNTLIDFFSQLCIYNTEEMNFNTFKNMANASILIDEYSLNYIFHETVTVQYSDKILVKDDDFFLKQETYNCEYEDINIINSVKKIWKKVDEENKEIIWNYLNVLLFLDNRINNSSNVSITNKK